MRPSLRFVGDTDIKHVAVSGTGKSAAGDRTMPAGVVQTDSLDVDIGVLETIRRLCRQRENHCSALRTECIVSRGIMPKYPLSTARCARQPAFKQVLTYTFCARPVQTASRKVDRPTISGPDNCSIAKEQ
ncbi:hypothetical protein ELH73_24290 (plasmid) [Rhizobium leguminosarum]|uniref:Uncharacterized protein n=1 Tax=Rhizobium leguminosarum TaxID=384 RepID=A0ABD7PJL3_RHILE|nr:hypothetical protein ELI28_24295 [Rhizobium leguminosarum]TAV66914.1 hypothetical protein ELI27_25285 [Rhizobium leguminosarum]TAW24840.1 hypothetical protein ELI19_25320 [Rhizobium leguminosarum]TAW38612.1 hypothetical protein ELI18_25290 [Rhizobium leguminosarum]TAY72223.1 hypothetical protein ELH83_30495 [Rhizobium leguminosarum]